MVCHPAAKTLNFSAAGQVIREGHARTRVEQNNIERLTSEAPEARGSPPPCLPRGGGAGHLSAVLHLSAFIGCCLSVCLFVSLPIC